MLGKAVMGTLPLRFPILTPSSRCAVRGLCLPVALGRTAGLRKVTRPPAGHGAAPTGEDTPRRTPAVSGPGAEGRRLRRGRTVTARREECMGRQVSPTCAPNRPFFMSGILSVNEAKNTSVQSRKLAFFGNVVSALVALLGIILIITELCMKSEMSYKNMSIAFVGKIVSGFLLLTSLLEFSLTFTYIYYIVCNWPHAKAHDPYRHGP
ncbi:membrane-spanning 4-domains subfamily A member 13 isoform X5 [Sarcophilus harrisii]|uniref:membrane-spanning 4-domains subfamily A member 13 isoform X5 n=1 Tax=Sarcophilus harrisii TaxID=9305 RepID=UPI001301C990|nr:membrane-spanning 4-domains subfamily A member 13 isoform X5 [Sarcophilus harrisii]